MQDINDWTTNKANRITNFKKLLSRVSLHVRADQLREMIQHFLPDRNTNVLDVGFAPKEVLPDTNFFEKAYIYPENITAVSVEDCSEIRSRYPKIRIVETKAGKRLPFKDREFDIAVSWATLEHVGSYKDQEFFLNEILRVGKKVYVTTPNRAAFYEPHTGFFFLHWLPVRWFRNLCKLTGKEFWAKEKNLNPLYISDVRKLDLIRKVDIKIYKTFNLIPSHIIITSDD